MLFFTKRNNSVPSDNSPSSRNIINREHDRFNYKTPVLFENHQTKEFARGAMYNYSKGGLYIEAEHCPQVGNGAVIHVVNYSPKAAGPDSIRKYHVQVRWVKQIPETKDPTQCSIGVKRCNDVYELFRLFGY